MVALNFDATNVPPDTGFDPVPTGVYHLCVDESEIKPTKNNNGMYLNMRFNILDGMYVGRKVWHRFNIRNDNQQTVEIAFKQLSSLARACGLMQVADSQHLHNIPIKARIKLRPAEGGYDESNDITKFMPMNDPTPVTMHSAAAPAGGMTPPPAGGFAPNPTPPTGFAPNPTSFAPQVAPAGFGGAPQPQPTQPQFAPQAPQPQPQQPQQGFAPPQQQAPQFVQPQATAPQTGWSPPPTGQPWNGQQPQPQPPIQPTQQMMQPAAPTQQQQPAAPQPPDATAQAAQSLVPPWQR